MENFLGFLLETEKTEPEPKTGCPVKTETVDFALTETETASPKTGETENRGTRF